MQSRREQEQRLSYRGCLFCTGIESDKPAHSRQKCPVFKELKRNCSKHPYVATRLEHKDEEGYAAAGILLWRRFGSSDAEFLMAREYRHGEDLLNFLGGKRLQKDTIALECAVNKVDSETGHQLSSETICLMRGKGCPLVIWSSASKYVLFLFELIDEGEQDVDIRALGIRGKHVKRLEWVSRSDLIETQFCKTEVHSYVMDLVMQLRRHDRINFLEKPFDSSKVKMGTIQKKRNPTHLAKRVQYFDVIGSIREVAIIARPNDPPLPFQPTWDELQSVCNSLHLKDLDKIERKFHADSYALYVGREPNQEEMKMSGLCRPIILGLIRSYNDDVKERKLAQEYLKELNEILGVSRLEDDQVQECVTEIHLKTLFTKLQIK